MARLHRAPSERTSCDHCWRIAAPWSRTTLVSQAASSSSVHRVECICCTRGAEGSVLGDTWTLGCRNTACQLACLLASARCSDFVPAAGGPRDRPWRWMSLGYTVRCNGYSTGSLIIRILECSEAAPECSEAAPGAHLEDSEITSKLFAMPKLKAFISVLSTIFLIYTVPYMPLVQHRILRGRAILGLPRGGSGNPPGRMLRRKRAEIDHLPSLQTGQHGPVAGPESMRPSL